jgi:O-antigen ligase
MTLYVLFIYNKDYYKTLNIRTYVLAFFFAFVLFVLFRSLEIFEWLFTEVLQRDITLTDRTGAWDAALMQIRERPLMGLGFETNPRIQLYGTAHNYFLHVLHRNGIVGLSVSLFMILLVARKLYRYRASQYSSILSFLVFTYLVMSIAESFSAREPFFYGALVMAYNVDSFILQDKNDLKMLNTDYLQNIKGEMKA